MKDDILGLTLLDYRMVDTQACLAAMGQLMHVLGRIDALWNYQSSVYLSNPKVQTSVRIAIYRSSIVSIPVRYF